MPDSIWAGIVGPTLFYCPYCGSIWPEADAKEYDAHIEAHAGEMDTKGDQNG